MVFTVKIKWGKKLFEGIELDIEEDIMTFKCQIYALTNVPIQKQKVMAKGKVLKDENEWNAYPGVKDGVTLMLMGTAEGGELVAPTKITKFVEDMTAEEKAAALFAQTGYIIPAGLYNLGNTCYMNSVVQCFKRVNELKDQIKTFELDPNHSHLAQQPEIALTHSAKSLFKDMDNKGESFEPEAFVMAMHHIFPMFAEKDDKGHPKQQDAEECYNQFLSYFQKALKYAKKTDKDGDAEMEDDTTADIDPVQRLFGIELETTQKCFESDAEPVKITKEHVMKLECHIDNNNKPIDTLDEGLDISLSGDVEKFSEVLQRNAVFKKTSKVNKLPGYLTVQFMRFYWKQESNVGGTKAGKAKILRQVNYPKVFDLYNHCSDELKKSLDLGREFEEKIRAEEDAARLEGKKDVAKESDAMMDGTAEAQTEEQKQEKKLVGAAAKAEETKQEQKVHDKILYRPHGQGLDTGNYELISVITHKGRSADGGHYKSWVHQTGDVWMCFDDDIVQTVKFEEILMLKGGGDRDTAYLCIYRKLEATK